MNHNELFFLAERLKNNDNEGLEAEVNIRNVIGRTYYYAYHEILKLIKDNDDLSQVYDEQKQKNGSHEALSSTFF